MAWTTPRTWVAGETLEAATFNLHIRDQLNYLKAERDTHETEITTLQAADVTHTNADAALDLRVDDLEAPPTVKVTRLSNQAISHNNLTSVTFTAYVHDTHSMWNAGQPTRVTIPAGWDGYWELYGYAAFAANVTGFRLGLWTISGVGYRYIQIVEAVGTSDTVITGRADEGAFAAGGYFGMQVMQLSGGSLNLTAAILAARFLRAS